jgi:hypothetical protein
MTVWSRIRDLFGDEKAEAVPSAAGVEATLADRDPLAAEPVAVLDAAAVGS